MMQLHQMTTFTQVHIAKLNAIFALGESGGLLSLSAFWNLMSVQYGGSLIIQTGKSLPKGDFFDDSEAAELDDFERAPEPCNTPSSPKTFLVDTARLATAGLSHHMTPRVQISSRVCRTYLNDNTLIGVRVFSFFGMLKLRHA